MGTLPASRTREGETLAGKYRLGACLGEGGMGQVYRARNVLVGREVAIKVLKPEHAQNEAIVTRFLREAKAANLVRHVNVVDVLDIGTDDFGAPFLVQELLYGEDLAARARAAGGKLSLREIVRVLGPVIEAVAAGHERGVIHRDLKPENVFLSEENGRKVPKLLDFGISQMRPRAGEAQMKQVGALMGTPQYMSPEQVKGHAVDARTDVWSLGVVMYELLAGACPFAEEMPVVFVSICGRDPAPLEDVAPEVPHEIALVVARCMKRDANERFANAGELAIALHEAYHLQRTSAAMLVAGAGPPTFDAELGPMPSRAPPLRISAPSSAPSLPSAPSVPALTPPPSSYRASPMPPPPWMAGSQAPTSGRGEVELAGDDDPETFMQPSFAEPTSLPPTSGLSLMPSSSPAASVRPRTLSSNMPFGPPPRPAKDAETAATLMAFGLLALGFGGGLVGAFVVFNAVDAPLLVSRIEPEILRTLGGLALLVAGILVGVRSFRSARADLGEKSTIAFNGALTSVLVFVGLKLLTAG